MKNYAKIIGIGSYVPERVLTNSNIEHMRPDGVEPENWTNDDWIFSRTGIKERRIAQLHEGSSDLMVKAARRALLDANLTIDQIDLIVTSTSFPDNGFNVPRTGEIFGSKINAKPETLIIEENAACAGSTWALERARMEMIIHKYTHVLVVSGDKVSASVDYEDRSTCILFGDGAGAVVLERGNCAGILKTIRQNDTQYLDSIEIPGGGSALPMTQKLLEQHAQFMHMPGGKNMIEVMGGKILPQIYEEMSRQVFKIKYVIPHQANIRIINLAKKKIERQLAKTGKTLGTIFFTDNIEIYGNTSGSSIFLALDTLYHQGLLEPGDLLLLVGFGAGFVYGANLLVWTKEKFKSKEGPSMGD
ncbi:MAG: beta-ketoacyl-ACP synthase 3 [Candidatus Berkelbacteria bacterium]